MANCVEVAREPKKADFEATLARVYTRHVTGDFAPSTSIAVLLI
jgi:hypothetical protein